MIIMKSLIELPNNQEKKQKQTVLPCQRTAAKQWKNGKSRRSTSSTVSGTGGTDVLSVLCELSFTAPFLLKMGRAQTGHSAELECKSTTKY